MTCTKAYAWVAGKIKLCMQSLWVTSAHDFLSRRRSLENTYMDFVILRSRPRSVIASTNSLQRKFVFTFITHCISKSLTWNHSYWMRITSWRRIINQWVWTEREIFPRHVRFLWLNWLICCTVTQMSSISSSLAIKFTTKWNEERVTHLTLKVSNRFCFDVWYFKCNKPLLCAHMGGLSRAKKKTFPSGDVAEV